MGIFDFVSNIGKKVFGDSEAEEAAAKAAEEKARAEAADEAAAQAAALAARNQAFAEGLQNIVATMEIPVEDLRVEYSDGTATIWGTSSQADMEKTVLLIGNSQGVARVDSRIEVKDPSEMATFHTVEKGDTLSKIAKAVYGDPMKYPAIFEANRPMIKDPDEIYPGQQLRIPPKSEVV